MYDLKTLTITINFRHEIIQYTMHREKIFYIRTEITYKNSTSTISVSVCNLSCSILVYMLITNLAARHMPTNTTKTSFLITYPVISMLSVNFYLLT